MNSLFRIIILVIVLSLNLQGSPGPETGYAKSYLTNFPYKIITWTESQTEYYLTWFNDYYTSFRVVKIESSIADSTNSAMIILKSDFQEDSLVYFYYIPGFDENVDSLNIYYPDDTKIAFETNNRPYVGSCQEFIAAQTEMRHYSSLLHEYNQLGYRLNDKSSTAQALSYLSISAAAIGGLCWYHNRHDDSREACQYATVSAIGSAIVFSLIDAIKKRPLFLRRKSLARKMNSILISTE